MDSPNSRLLELLGCEGVSLEAKAILTTILRRCANVERMETFIFQAVDKSLQEQDLTFSVGALFEPAGGDQGEPRAACAQRRRHMLHLTAKSLNMQAERWMDDFLLLAVGKRSYSGSFHLSYSDTLYEPTDELLRASSADILRRNMEQEVGLRDGEQCCVSGSAKSVVCVQIIPSSEDPGRLNRFKVLAQVFFLADVVTFDEKKLLSVENCVMLSMFWKDRLDRGLLIFRFIDGDFHAIPLARNDSDTLVEERSINGLCGPSRLELYGGKYPEKYPRLNPLLTWVHQFLVKTLLDTGFRVNL